MKDSSTVAVAMAAFVAFAMGCPGPEEEAGTDDTAASAGDDTAGSPGDDTAAPDPLATDDDLDGFAENDGDCNDRNDGVYPGARERSHDGVDSDCDGEDLPALSEDRFDEALPLLDTDGDQAVSFAEFETACARSAMVVDAANPGVVQTHVSCGGTNSCRGMVLHSWEALYEHDCRGVNSCAGWSCVETATDAGRDGATAFTEARCDWCHSGSDGGFLVQVPAGEDPDAWVEGFLERTDAQFLAAIAFGVSGVSADGVAYADMPAHYGVLSRAEMETLIAYVRTLPIEGPSDG